jgi:hypothetical protein
MVDLAIVANTRARSGEPTSFVEAPADHKFLVIFTLHRRRLAPFTWK